MWTRAHARSGPDSPITPAGAATAGFDANLLYQLKVDNSGDGVEARVLQFTVTGTGASQRVSMRGQAAPALAGTRNTLVTSGPTLTGATNATLGSATGVPHFAGVGDDPFFIDLEQFFRIIPGQDRRLGHDSPMNASSSDFKTLTPVRRSIVFSMVAVAALTACGNDDDTTGPDAPPAGSRGGLSRSFDLRSIPPHSAKKR